MRGGKKILMLDNIKKRFFGKVLTISYINFANYISLRNIFGMMQLDFLIIYAPF